VVVVMLAYSLCNPAFSVNPLRQLGVARVRVGDRNARPDVRARERVDREVEWER
jgi:hypothetical protein